MLRTHIEEISENLYLLRIDDDKIKYFEAIWEIPEGITYNAYLLFGGNKTVLFDAWKADYSDLFIKKLREFTDLKDIDYMVIHHMEPDHSGSIPKLLPLLNKETVFIGHPLTKSMIKSFYGVTPHNFKNISDGEALNLGKYNIKFIHTPWLHWPETIMTYINEKEILLSCDAFGAYSIPKTIYYDENLGEKYIHEARKYFVTIIGHYRNYVVKNLDKIENIKMKLRWIAPSHGVIWKKPEKILNYYRRWSLGEREEGKIVIVYSSMYGFTDKVVSILYDELSKKGVKPLIFKYTDKNRPYISDILSEIIDADAIVIGAATYESGVFPHMLFLLEEIIQKSDSEKPVLILSAYGWGKVAGREISSMLENTRFKVIDTIEFRSGVTPELKMKLKEDIEKLLSSI